MSAPQALPRRVCLDFAPCLLKQRFARLAAEPGRCARRVGQWDGVERDSGALGAEELAHGLYEWPLSEKSRNGHAPNRQDELRAQERQLGVEPGGAGSHFGWVGLAI